MHSAAHSLVWGRPLAVARHYREHQKELPEGPETMSPKQHRVEQSNRWYYDAGPLTASFLADQAASARQHELIGSWATVPVGTQRLWHHSDLMNFLRDPEYEEFRKRQSSRPRSDVWNTTGCFTLINQAESHDPTYSSFNTHFDRCDHFECVARDTANALRTSTTPLSPAAHSSRAEFSTQDGSWPYSSFADRSFPRSGTASGSRSPRDQGYISAQGQMMASSSNSPWGSSRQGAIQRIPPKRIMNHMIEYLGERPRTPEAKFTPQTRRNKTEEPFCCPDLTPPNIPVSYGRGIPRHHLWAKAVDDTAVDASDKKLQEVLGQLKNVTESLMTQNPHF